MLSEQDTRAVEAMVRCNMELDDLCDIFPAFEREDISGTLRKVCLNEAGVAHSSSPHIAKTLYL